MTQPGEGWRGSARCIWQGRGASFASTWLAVDFGVRTAFSSMTLSEFGDRKSGYRIEYWNGSGWSAAHTGTTIGASSTVTFFSAGCRARLRVATYRITNRGDGWNDRDPSAWRFQGSNDGVTWTTLDSRTGVTWPGSPLRQGFTLPVDRRGDYLYYRLLITAASGSTVVTLAELELMKERAWPSGLLPGLDGVAGTHGGASRNSRPRWSRWARASTEPPVFHEVRGRDSSTAAHPVSPGCPVSRGRAGHTRSGPGPRCCSASPPARGR